MGAWQNLRSATKSSQDRWIGGVCGGLGAATPIPSLMWRVAFILLSFAYGAGLILYATLWNRMPKNQGGSEAGAPPNGGPTTPSGIAAATEGRPSVS